jgi:hypothetical protein
VLCFKVVSDVQRGAILICRSPASCEKITENSSQQRVDIQDLPCGFLDRIRPLLYPMLDPLLIRLRRFDIVLREKHLDFGHACEGQYIVGHRLSVSRRKLLALAGPDFADLLGF